jgi:hypothetical protein
MRDQATHHGKPYGLANFLANGIYLSYTMAHVRVTTKGGDKIEGHYDMSGGLLKGEGGQQFALDAQTFMTMITQGRVEYLGGVVAKVTA